MDKSRNRWKEEHRHPKLFDEREPPTQQNGKIASSSSSSSATVTTVLKNQSSSSSSNNNNSNKLAKNEIMNQLAQNLPEDVRISKLLRRLETETSVTGTIEICGKLKIVVQDQANANYIKRSFDMLTNSLISVMKECHSQEALAQVAEVYGMMGFVMRNDFPLYKSWICKTYKSMKSMRVSMMNALETTLKMDANDLRLNDQMGRLMELLRDFLEQTEDYKVFIAITEVLIVIAQNYNARYFKPHFSNIVDIVIGWMMEPIQQPKVKIHCSIVLQNLQPFWKSDTKFTLDLMGQLSEDVDGCVEKLETSEEESKVKSFRDFSAFVGEWKKNYLKEFKF